MGVIIFNGFSSADKGIQIESPPNYEFPEKDYEFVHIPGKSGDIVIDKGSYKNVNRNYDISVGSYDGDFTVLANGISEWLHSANGYARLEDSYEPDYYRMAVYNEGISIENILMRAGRATISFNCKPQRFLKTGEEPITFNNSGLIYNPTVFASLPVVTIRGNGAGVLRIGSYAINILDVSDYMVIDSSIQDAYRDTTNLNASISLVNGFPKLLPGKNEISFSGEITSVEVIPIWWTL